MFPMHISRRSFRFFYRLDFESTDNGYFQAFVALQLLVIYMWGCQTSSVYIYYNFGTTPEIKQGIARSQSCGARKYFLMELDNFFLQTVVYTWKFTTNYRFYAMCDLNKIKQISDLFVFLRKLPENNSLFFNSYLFVRTIHINTHWQKISFY